ncbi:hypothetical protein LTS08_006130 [Lithohypha guttulata]|uniref:uncharacterized protein n=1 Tax=Lithohypha guttulata TaxID=1690604 RepID=UPI002DDF56AA|nr:hypothetical protein LTR51_002867 [Lithohypha guttulata]KAK5098752.1 hypothetical protein LTS08_006130 [Lithohypha guttulata]
MVQTLIPKIQQYISRPLTSTSAAVLDGTLQIVANSHFTPTLAVETPGLVLENESSHEPYTYDHVLQPPIDRSGDTSDGRRGLKRRAEDIGIQAEAFGTLLSSIRSADESSLLQLRDLARDDRAIEELIRVARDILRSNELRTKNQIRLRQAVMSIGTLIDIPPIRIPASPWTQVTDDDDAVSHSVSVYFTWQHHAYPSLNKDVFVEHMISRDLAS